MSASLSWGLGTRYKWWTTTNPYTLLGLMARIERCPCYQSWARRKARLIACAVTRAAHEYAPEDLELLDFAEDYVGGERNSRKRYLHRERVADRMDYIIGRVDFVKYIQCANLFHCLAPNHRLIRHSLPELLADNMRHEGPPTRSQTLTRDFVAHAVRDLVGAPFLAPSLVLPGTPVITSLARAAHDDGRDQRTGRLDNARLAVLSDALEECGVTDEKLLRHLRSPKPHYRGCWALDHALGRPGPSP